MAYSPQERSEDRAIVRRQHLKEYEQLLKQSKVEENHMPRPAGSTNIARPFVNPNLDDEIMFHIWKIVEIVRADAKIKIAEALEAKTAKRRERGPNKPKQK
jgi:hypothetical protein